MLRIQIFENEYDETNRKLTPEFTLWEAAATAALKYTESLQCRCRGSVPVFCVHTCILSLKYCVMYMKGS